MREPPVTQSQLASLLGMLDHYRDRIEALERLTMSMQICARYPDLISTGAAAATSMQDAATGAGDAT